MRAKSIFALLLLSACGPGEPADTSEAETSSTTGDGDGDGDPTTGDGDPTTGDGEGDPMTGDGDGDPATGDGDGEPAEPCSCVMVDAICEDDEGTATYDCALDSPCGVVGDSPLDAECALQLLVAQEPARFRYDLYFSNDGGFEYDIYRGWFHILGPGEGLDNECYIHGVDLSSTYDEDASYYTLEDPSYFQACLDGPSMNFESCMFGGMDANGNVPECR